MRRILLILILLSTLCQAQDYYVPRSSYQPRQLSNPKDSTKRTASFFSFNIGVSVPLRDYAAKTTSNNFMIIGPDSTHGKGFANAGFHIDLNGGIFMTPNFGFCTKFAYNQNSFDDETLNLLVNGNYNYSVYGDYSIWQILAGPFGNFQLGKTTSIWVQGLVGIIIANFPSFSIYNLPLNQFPPYISWNFTLPDAANFAYSFNMGFEKNLTRNTSLIATVSYTGAELSYPGLSFNLSGPYTGLPPPYTQNTPVTMSFGSLDFSIGVLIHM